MDCEFGGGGLESGSKTHPELVQLFEHRDER